MSSKTARSNAKTVIEAGLPKAKRGPKPKLVVEFPEPLASEWIEVSTFPEALALHVARHGETICHLHRSLACQGDEIARSTLLQWAAGKKAPSSVASMIILSRIERRYRLPSGYFRAKLFNNARAPTGHKGLKGVSPSERRRLAWHLPDDFDRRSAKEREEILHWVRSVIISGSTEYRRYQAEAVKQRFGIRFPDLTDRRPIGELDLEDDEDIQFLADVEMDLTAAAVDAPPRLADEMADLIRFKTATLTEIGFQRNGVWNSVTGAQKIEHLGLLFGALAASPRSEIKGFGVPHRNLAFGMLVFPAVWDWYVQWRERRRGFYTSWEVNMIQLGLSLMRAETGWLRQNPQLGARLRIIPGLISSADVVAARSDWESACERFYKHGLARAKEIQRVARVHRDPFEPILPVLEADSPVAEYRRITEEILRLMPDARRYPRQAAESVRSFLMVRLALHLGLRQKNLRELLFCPRGRPPTAERILESRRRGELRWSERDQGWEVNRPGTAGGHLV